MCATRGCFVRPSQVRHRALRRLSWVTMVEPVVRVGDDHLAKGDGITSAFDQRPIQREITAGTDSQVRGELRARTGGIWASPVCPPNAKTLVQDAVPPLRKRL